MLYGKRDKAIILGLSKVVYSESFPLASSLPHPPPHSHTHPLQLLGPTNPPPGNPVYVKVNDLGMRQFYYCPLCWLLLCKALKRTLWWQAFQGFIQCVRAGAYLNVQYRFKRPLDKLLHSLSLSKHCPWVICMWLLTLRHWNSSLNYLFVYSL